MLKNEQINIVKSILGDDIFQTLKKYEIYKPENQTVVDPAEIKIALQIVPRTVLSFLFAHLKNKKMGDVIDLDLPFIGNSKLHVEKKGNDSFTGQVVKEGRVVNNFKNRPLPSVGLILLTSLELYSEELLEEIKENKATEKDNDRLDSLQDIIDERLSLNSLVNDVIDQRISQREAINTIIGSRLNRHLLNINSNGSDMISDKKSKLRQFLYNREKKRDSVIDSFDKSEIDCPDCKETLYKSEYKNTIKLCICYGTDMNKYIKFSKNEDGMVKFKFPKSFDIENIEMLLDAFKNRKEVSNG